MAIHHWPPPNRRGAIIAAGLGTLLLVAAAVTTIILVVGGNGDGNKPAEAKVETPTATASACNLQIHDDLVVMQNGNEHTVSPLAIKSPIPDFVPTEGQADLTFTFSRDNGPATAEQTYLEYGAESIPQVTDSFGKVTFKNVNLTLNGQNQRENPFTLKYGQCKTDFSFVVGKPAPNGSVNPDGSIVTGDQLGVPPKPGAPHTVNFKVDPKFVEAFARFCGFTPDQATDVGLIQNDVQRFQVAWTGTDFVQSSHTIEPGQYIWAVWFGDKECVVNPPCGNPTVAPGKLPMSPPEEQLPPPHRKEVPTSTPVPASSNTPSSATNTPVSPSATPVTPTAVPTSTPPAPTFTPVGPCPCPPLTETPATFYTRTPVRDPTSTQMPSTATQIPAPPTKTPVSPW